MNRETKTLHKTYRNMQVAKGNKSPFKAWVIGLAKSQGPLRAAAIQWIRNKGLKNYHRKPVRV